jgi:hypothetical protein
MKGVKDTVGGRVAGDGKAGLAGELLRFVGGIGAQGHALERSAPGEKQE